jgi:hypothetical protein
MSAAEFMHPLIQRYNRAGQLTWPWCLTPPQQGTTFVFPFNSSTSAAKKLQQAIRNGYYVDVGEFTGEALAAEEAAPTITTISLGAGINIQLDSATSTASSRQHLQNQHPLTFVAAFNRYIEAVMVVHPLQTDPLRHYLALLVDLGVGHLWGAVLAYDSAHRKRIAATGDPIDIIDITLRSIHLAPAAMINPCLKCLSTPCSCGAKGKRSDLSATPRTPAPQTPSNQRICWKYNSMAGCTSQTCSFQHVCQKCKTSGHTKLNCGIPSTTPHQSAAGSNQATFPPATRAVTQTTPTNATTPVTPPKPKKD